MFCVLHEESKTDRQIKSETANIDVINENLWGLGTLHNVLGRARTMFSFYIHTNIVHTHIYRVSQKSVPCNNTIIYLAHFITVISNNA